MKKLILIISYICFVNNLIAQSFIVGVNIKNPINSINIKERFLIKEGSDKWKKNSLVIPFEISDNDIKNSIIRLAFILRILKMEEGQYNDYWIREKSKGRIRRPIKVESFKMMKKYLERERGGIGYLPEDMVNPKKIKIIGRFDL